jgi:hypothetical protein
LLELVNHKRFLHLKKVVKQHFVVLIVDLLCRLGFVYVAQCVVEIVDQVETEKFLQKSVLKLRKHVDIALLTVPCL